MRVKEAIDRLEREKERNFETRNSNKERIRFEIISYIYTFIEIEKFNRIERWKKRDEKRWLTTDIWIARKDTVGRIALIRPSLWTDLFIPCIHPSPVEEAKRRFYCARSSDQREMKLASFDRRGTVESFWNFQYGKQLEGCSKWPRGFRLQTPARRGSE